MPGIVVGIDGSDHSRHALEWAVSEAALRHAPLTVLTVNQAVAGYGGGPVEYPGDPDRARHAEEEAQKLTDSVIESVAAQSQPLSVSVQAVTGFPVEELLRASAGADMIVVSSRGTGGFKRLRMGSVATQLTHHAHCPVVVIPAGDA
jgi:nucleotide-binding universal stress UspA family protein